jgi:hypothetical protein
MAYSKSHSEHAWFRVPQRDRNNYYYHRDGDKPETSPLLDILIIELYFPHVVRLRCGWHVMDAIEAAGLQMDPKTQQYLLVVLKLRSSPLDL